MPSSNLLLKNEFIELKSHKRCTELYLRALWGKGFFLAQGEMELTSFSYIVGNTIYLPRKISSDPPNLLYYRAAASHAAAHNIYGGIPFCVSDLNLMQRSMIGLIEDLRVELLAIRQFPGLGKIWIEFHALQQDRVVSAQNLMMRLSRSALDQNYEDNHQWVTKGRQLIMAASSLNDPDFSRVTGLQLANDLGQMRLPLNSGRYEQLIAYRDDNRCLWQKTVESRQDTAAFNQGEDTTVEYKNLREDAQGIQMLIAENNREAGAGFYIRQQDNPAIEYFQVKQNEPLAKVFYPEWDYRTRILKNNWCTLREAGPAAGSMEEVENIFEKHKIILNRLRHLAKSLQAVKMQRIRKIQDGDEIDLDPVINAMIAMKSNESPDARVFVRNVYRQTRSLAVTILLDLSESTNEMTGDIRISQLMRDAVLLLGETLSVADEQFSIAGFSSNGRHEVNFINFKKFSQSFDDAKANLTGLRGQYSTRLGTAIRHSGRGLAQQPVDKKLLLVITDGAPADIDVYDQRYLEYESRHAVQALARNGIKSFCINLDGRADGVIEHIFGKGRYETLDHLARLPEVLSCFYLRHVRH